MFSAYLGREYSEKEIRGAINKYFKGTHKISDNISKDTAELLSKNLIIGWFQGRSEFGPRALGHRSIFANPRNKNMKEILNEKVKFREEFRPFAPIFLQEETTKWFGKNIDNPYMLIVKKVLSDCRYKIPAVVHVDNTARLQTITKEQDLEIYNLLVELGRLTNVAVVLNTSFNVKGEPIVESPKDAILCFLKTDIDALVLGRNILIKERTSTNLA